MGFRFIQRLCVFCFAAMALQSCGGNGQPTGAANAQCSAPLGYELTDIQSVVDWVNAMEKPLTLPCFIQSLPRPLATHSAYSIFSAQPSIGTRSPRVFFFFDKLILTVATDQDLDKDLPAEDETHLLELSFLVDLDNLITTKGELKFPINQTIPDSMPYQKIDFDESHSNCFACHDLEMPYGEIEGFTIYQSLMLRSSEPLSVNDLINESAICDANSEPHRCAMLKSITDYGVLIPSVFPEDAPTIYN